MADKISKFRKMIQSGCIFQAYTQKSWFIKVTPTLSIDKVKFSFVEKGKKGSGFDIYVDVMVYNRLCKDISSRVLERKIAEDNGSYPSAWNYVTGENGNLYLAIGKGEKGIIIQGRNKEKKKNAFVPVVSYNELLIMADLWLLLSKTYFSEIENMFLSALTEIEKYHKSGVGLEQENEYHQPEDTTPIQHSSTQNDLKTITVVTKTKLTAFGTKGNLCFKAQDEEMNDFVIVIIQEDISLFDKTKWNTFQSKAEKEMNIPITITVNTSMPDRMILKKLA